MRKSLIFRNFAVVLKEPHPMSIALFIRSIGLLAVACGLAPLLIAQNGQAGKATLGSISGRLHDQVGAVVVNVRVIVTSSSRSTDNNTVEAVSNLEGEFKIDNIPSGIYSVRIEGQGFNVLLPYPVVVANNKTVELNVRLHYKQACDGETNNSRYVLRDEDKEDLVRQILRHVFVVGDWAGPVDLLREEGQLPLHTDNIDPEWVRGYLPKEIVLLSDASQHKGTGAKDTSYYLKFSQFDVRGSCVTVALIHDLTDDVTSENSPTLGAGAYIYEFRKNASKWVGKCIGGFVS